MTLWLNPPPRAEPWGRTSADLPHGKATRVTVLIDEYLRSQRYLSVSPDTKQDYLCTLRALDNLILATGRSIYHMRSNDVDYSTVDYLFRILSYTRKPATIKGYFAVLSNVWEVALRNGRVILNPWRLSGIKLNNTRDVTWTPQQIQDAIRVSKEMGFHILALYLIFCYETAQRPWRDLGKLKWSNIIENEDGSVIFDFVVSKTGVHLMLPLSGVAKEALKNITRKSEYVFSNEHGKLYKDQTMRNQLEKVKKHAGIPDHLQIRDIRRTVVTEMAENGATSEEIRSITGWKSAESVIHRYARIRLKTATHAIEKLEKARQGNTIFGPIENTG